MPMNTPLSIMYFNARSIFNKFDKFELLVLDHKPDMVCITETWAHKNIFNAKLSLSGYTLEPELRVDRSDTTNGIGGRSWFTPNVVYLLSPNPLRMTLTSTVNSVLNLI